MKQTTTAELLRERLLALQEALDAAIVALRAAGAGTPAGAPSDPPHADKSHEDGGGERASDEEEDPDALEEEEEEEPRGGSGKHNSDTATGTSESDGDMGQARPPLASSAGQRQVSAPAHIRQWRPGSRVALSTPSLPPPNK